VCVIGGSRRMSGVSTRASRRREISRNRRQGVTVPNTLFEKGFRGWVPIRLGQQPRRKLAVREVNSRRPKTAERLGFSGPIRE
jgi:hypothetical protein